MDDRKSVVDEKQLEGADVAVVVGGVNDKNGVKEMVMVSVEWLV